MLKNMAAAGYLSPAAAGKAASRTGNGGPWAAAAFRSRRGRYFTDWVLEQVSGYVNPGDRDIVVRTTLDSHLQGSPKPSPEGATNKV